MYSISFPEMFNSSRFLLYNDNEATESNLKLLLKSYKTGLFGDPDYGTNLQKAVQHNNSVVLQDLVIDDIYTAIKVFMPQVVVERKDITLQSYENKLVATVKYTSLIDYTTNLYTINLIDSEET